MRDIRTCTTMDSHSSSFNGCSSSSISEFKVSSQHSRAIICTGNSLILTMTSSPSIDEYPSEPSSFKGDFNASISKNNKVCLSFFWEEHERQVIIKGYAKKISDLKSNKYFNSRPRGSQLGAIVSNQSAVIDSKKELEENLINLESKYRNKSIPKPTNWGGYIVSPVEYEFWQGGENRLHDRARFLYNDNHWAIDRLSP